MLKASQLFSPMRTERDAYTRNSVTHPGSVETPFLGGISQSDSDRNSLVPIRTESQIDPPRYVVVERRGVGKSRFWSKTPKLISVSNACSATTGTSLRSMKPEQSELALGGLNTRKTDKTGDTVGQPSCQSSLLSDPNAKFSAEMWRKPQRTRKVRRAATLAAALALTFTTFS